MRAWLHGRLSGDPTLQGLLPGGFHAHNSFTQVPQAKPFLVHRFGIASPLLKDGNQTVTVASPVQVWVHDEPGTYERIDNVLDRVKTLLETAVANGDLIQAEWVETSEEFFDVEMGTALRFGRFRLVHNS